MNKTAILGRLRRVFTLTCRATVPSGRHGGSRCWKLRWHRTFHQATDHNGPVWRGRMPTTGCNSCGERFGHLTTCEARWGAAEYGSSTETSS